MKKIILFLVCTCPFFLQVVIAQPNIDRKRDMQWIVGYQSEYHNIYPQAGNTIIDFNGGVVSTAYNYRSIDFSVACSSICDTLGSLNMYTNGIYIANRFDQKMINGDSLDYGYWWEQWKEIGSRAIQSVITLLPTPCSPDCVTMVYPHISQEPSGSPLVRSIQMATIDPNYNNQGIVTKKDSILVQDSMQSAIITACRHANGRDWWLIAPRFGLGLYHKILLTAHGNRLHSSQTASRVPVNQAGFSIFASYSPNGAKYAHYDATVGTWIYDFNRCTGELSNRQLLPRPSTRFGDIYCGLAFSPNSRFLYLTNDTSVVQYDMNAINITASKQLVAILDTVRDRGSRMPFMLMQLAPDGKIYISSWNSIRFMHVIDKPDLAGVACNVIQHGLALPTVNNSTMPNFPNFRLGALKNSPCDSLGIEAGVTVGTNSPLPEKEAVADFRLFPNPATDYTLLLWDAPLAAATELDVFDAIGQAVFHTVLPPETTYYKLPLQNLPVGVYVATLRGNGFRVSQKLIHVNP